MATAAMIPELPEYDRAKEIKEFDESKMGVKGLVDSGATAIPPLFIHPPENLINLNPTTPSNSPSQEIPLIDLTGVNSNRRSEIVEQMRQACHSWGFFQVSNHGIPDTILKDSITAVNSFHEQPAAWKKEFYSRDRDQGFSFFPSFDLFHAKAGGWRDSIKVQLGWNQVDPGRIPAICRKEILAWDEHVTSLVDTLMELLSQGLGVRPDFLKEMTCLEERTLVGNYYPCCPQAELTLGITSHSDPVVLTVLQQNQIAGLQVKHDGEWVNVKPLPGALVINVGDVLQILSNNEYQSVDHRAVANSCRESRISIAMFFLPSKTGEHDYYGPLPELLSPENPPLYRNFTFPEYHGRFYSRDMQGKSCIDCVRL